MNIFITGIVTTFVTLVIAASITNFPKDYGKVLMAGVVYGGLSVFPIPIPVFGMFVAPIGMYMVLIGSNYSSHKSVMKLCIVSFIVNVAILTVLIWLTN